MMPDPTSLSISLLANGDETDFRLERTVAAVDWNALASLACTLHGTTTSRWGDQLSGGYNVVRFLHLDDVNHTVVVRVPYRPDNGWTREYIKAFAPQMSSEVAIMRYVMAHTSIPVPRIIHHCIEADGRGVGSPYMMMAKVDGVPLSSIWDDMEDTKREIVLRMVVDILLELASHRFDKIGTIFQRESDDATKQEWYVAPTVGSPRDTSASNSVSSRTFTSAVDYWLTYANANLESIRDTNFGKNTKIYQYGHAWFMRSIIPALYDPSLDATGFPICPEDFHSQNIMIVNGDKSPRISAVIDWEFSGPGATSSFAQYPLFIVDHPMWEDDNPLRERNVRDQATFNVLMREAEMKEDPMGDLPLSRTFANCQGVYLFEQAIQFPYMFPAIYPQLWAYVYGEECDFSANYYGALMENGILRKEAGQFEKETEVWKEAFKTLGDELVSRSMSREEFRTVVRKHGERFLEGGLVREWLAT
jgi:aminoglycoside phosphotransferase (APT) family kinase protein